MNNNYSPNTLNTQRGSRFINDTLNKQIENTQYINEQSKNAMFIGKKSLYPSPRSPSSRQPGSPPRNPSSPKGNNCDDKNGCYEGGSSLLSFSELATYTEKAKATIDQAKQQLYDKIGGFPTKIRIGKKDCVLYIKKNNELVPVKRALQESSKK